jgi:hypothetical protein
MKKIITILLLLSVFNLSAKTDTANEIEKYTLFIKSYGLAIYFTPHKGYKTEDWEKFLLQSIHELNQIKNTQNSLEAINNLYKKINIPIQIDTIENKILDKKNKIKTDTYYWKHTGLGLGKDKLPNITKLITAGYKSNIETQNNSYTKYENINLINEYYCHFPLYSNQITELKKLELTETKFSKRDRDFALLTYVWNLYNYFYPYSTDLEISWDKHLQEAINSLLNNEEISDVLSKLNIVLNDAHSYIAIDSKNKGLTFVKRSYYPINFEYLDNKVVVSSISKDYHTTVNIGDILTNIDDKKIDTIISNLTKTYSGKHETAIHSVIEGWSKQGFLSSLFNAFPSDSLKLTFSDKQELQKEIVLSKTANIYQKYSDQILEVDGYYYIDAGEVNYKEFKKMYKSIELSKGIVFDLRSHPTYSFTRILSHFTKIDLVLDNLFTAITTSPRKDSTEYESVVGFKIKSSKKQINTPAYFIIGPGLYSYGESCIHLINKGNLGLTIGDNTGGCNGDMNFNRIFNTTLAWTGKKVLNNEGEVFQGIGYKPDIYFNFKSKHADKNLLLKDLLIEIKKTPNKL